LRYRYSRIESIVYSDENLFCFLPPEGMVYYFT
jgi:hypothetical protein